MNDVIKLDFETFYSPTYNLDKLGTSLYVRDPQFKVWQVGIQINDGAIGVYNNSHDDLLVDPIHDALHEIDWSKAILVCHNTLFDGFILAHHYNIVPRFYVDTLAMARARYFFLDNDLDSLDTRLHGIGKVFNQALTAIKGIRNPSTDQLNALAHYTVGDVEALDRCYTALSKDFPSAEMEIIDMTIRMFTQPELEIDHALARQVVAAEENEKHQMCHALGLTLKQVRSNKQFAELIRERGVEVPTKISMTTGKETEAFSQADAGFQMLAENPAVADLVECRLRVKSSIVETRAKALSKNAQNGFKLPVALNYWGAITGRWSGANKINMQNLPKSNNFRHMVLAPEGHVLVVCDSSQIECRLTAWFADQHNLLQTFRDKRDPYCEFATTYYGREITKADESERFMGKSAVLGLGYGMGADRFLEDTLSKAKLYGITIDIDLEKAQRAVDVYRSLNSNIRQMWSNCTRWIHIMATPKLSDWWKCCGFANQRLYLPNDMYIHYPNLTTAGEFTDMRRSAKTPIKRIYSSHFYENIIQALARIVIAEQMRTINQRYRPVMCTHDEVVVVAPEDEADEALNFMIESMRQPPAWCESIPLDAEGKFARYYSK